MGANIFGTHFQILTFGESHGPALGVAIEGCPAGVLFSWELMRACLHRRRPGQFPWMSDRKERDEPELLSGVFEGRTLGTPLVLLVRNTDCKSEDYLSIKKNPRPGHADDVWKKKFGHADYRGGGRASGRETVSRVLGGAVAEMFLKSLYKELKVKAFPIQIGPFARKTLDSSSLPQKEDQTNWFGEQTKEVENFLIQKKSEGLSYGGAIQVEILDPPENLGQPVFQKLKSDMAFAFMSIGACYEVSLGDKSPEDFDTVSKHSLFLQRDISLEEGSYLHGLKKASLYGGIRGGISTGEKIIFQLKFKPPASVLKVAKKGRHDPCIVPRVVAIAEAMAWLVIADHVLWARQDRLY